MYLPSGLPSAGKIAIRQLAVGGQDAAERPVSESGLEEQRQGKSSPNKQLTRPQQLAVCELT
jgi:hypothetical protein